MCYIAQVLGWRSKIDEKISWHLFIISFCSMQLLRVLISSLIRWRGNHFCMFSSCLKHDRIFNVAPVINSYSALLLHKPWYFVKYMNYGLQLDFINSLAYKISACSSVALVSLGWLWCISPIIQKLITCHLYEFFKY